MGCSCTLFSRAAYRDQLRQCDQNGIYHHIKFKEVEEKSKLESRANAQAAPRHHLQASTARHDDQLESRGN